MAEKIYQITKPIESPLMRESSVWMNASFHEFLMPAYLHGLEEEISFEDEIKLTHSVGIGVHIDRALTGKYAGHYFGLFDPQQTEPGATLTAQDISYVKSRRKVRGKYIPVMQRKKEVTLTNNKKQQQEGSLEAIRLVHYHGRIVTDKGMPRWDYQEKRLRPTVGGKLYGYWDDPKVAEIRQLDLFARFLAPKLGTELPYVDQLITDEL